MGMRRRAGAKETAKVALRALQATDGKEFHDQNIEEAKPADDF